MERREAEECREGGVVEKRGMLPKERVPSDFHAWRAR